MSIPAELDHVVIAGPHLGDLVDWFAARTGVVATPGGVHPTGTANALVAFTVDGRRGPRLRPDFCRRPPLTSQG